MAQDGETPVLIAAGKGNVGALKVLIDFGADLNKALPVRLFYFKGRWIVDISTLSVCLFVWLSGRLTASLSSEFTTNFFSISCLQLLTGLILSIINSLVVNEYPFSLFSYYKFHLLSLSLSLCLSPLCDQDGATPTYIAAQNDHVEALELLCKHGADVNKANQASSYSRLLP